MTQVDFHFNAPDKLQYACRLIRKIYRAGKPVVVACEDADQRDTLDQLLWTFSARDFIPHVCTDDPLADSTPVLLGIDCAQAPHHEVIVNLGRTTPSGFGRFARLIEVVAADEEDRSQARERWRHYRDRGYPMTRHDLSATDKREQ